MRIEIHDFCEVSFASLNAACHVRSKWQKNLYITKHVWQKGFCLLLLKKVSIRIVNVSKSPDIWLQNDDSHGKSEILKTSENLKNRINTPLKRYL